MHRNNSIGAAGVTRTSAVSALTLSMRSAMPETNGSAPKAPAVMYRHAYCHSLAKRLA
jgi:hypothetical protein